MLQNFKIILKITKKTATDEAFAAKVREAKTGL